MKDTIKKYVLTPLIIVIVACLALLVVMEMSTINGVLIENDRFNTEFNKSFIHEKTCIVEKVNEDDVYVEYIRYKVPMFVSHDEIIKQGMEYNRIYETTLNIYIDILRAKAPDFDNVFLDYILEYYIMEIFDSNYKGFAIYCPIYRYVYFLVGDLVI